MTLHLQAADDPQRPDPQSRRDDLCASGAMLTKFFALAWRDFLNHQEWEGPDLMEAIAAAGLGEYRHATSKDIGDNSCYEVGDQILVLTDAGRAAIREAQRAEFEGRSPEQAAKR